MILFDKKIIFPYNNFNVILKLLHLMKGKSSLLRQVPESRWMVKTGDGGQRKILPEDWRWISIKRLRHFHVTGNAYVGTW